MRARHNAGKRRQGVLRGKTVQKANRLPAFDDYEYDASSYLLPMSADDLAMMGTPEAIEELRRRDRDEDGIKLAWKHSGRVPKHYRVKSGRNSPEFKMSTRAYNSSNRGESMRANPSITLNELNRKYIDGNMSQKEYLMLRAQLEGQTQLALLNGHKTPRRAQMQKYARKNYVSDMPSTPEQSELGGFKNKEQEKEWLRNCLGYAVQMAKSDINQLRSIAEQAYADRDVDLALNAVSNIKAARIFQLGYDAVFRPAEVGNEYMPLPWEDQLSKKIEALAAAKHQQMFGAPMRAAANPSKSRSRRPRRR